MSLPTHLRKKRKKWLTIQEMTMFSMFGALMYCSKIVMEWAPNVHLIGMFTMVFTLTYRAKGLIPVYVFVFVTGLYSGFNLWWVPYLYIWTVLWGVTMMLPKKMKNKTAAIVYPVVCAMHGICFGLLYSPSQMLFWGYNFKQTVAWVISGFFPWDVIHGIGNFAAGFLILPLVNILRKIDKNAYRIS